MAARESPSAFVDLDARRDLLAEQSEYLSRLGVPAGCALREEHAVVDLDVEHAVRAGHELPLRDHVLVVVRSSRTCGRGLALGASAPWSASLVAKGRSALLAERVRSQDGAMMPGCPVQEAKRGEAQSG